MKWTDFFPEKCHCRGAEGSRRWGLAPNEQRPFAGQLAETLTRSLLAKGPQRFSSFLGQASSDDSGQAACQGHFGESLGQVLSPLLGPGEWDPPLSPLTRLLALLEDKRWNEAVECANQALEHPYRDPDQLRLGRARALVNTPDWRNALDDYRSLPQRLCGTNVMVEELWLLLALQDFTAAERLLIKIARKNLPEAQRHKPYFLYAQGRYPEAMAAFETASLAQSGKYVGLGWTAWKMGQSEKATEYATLSLAAARTLEPLLLVAQLTLDAGSLDEAEDHIKECLELDPCDITGLHLQGCLAEARDQPDQAREAFQRCVEEGPKRRRWPPEQQRVEDARRRLVAPD